MLAIALARYLKSRDFQKKTWKRIFIFFLIMGFFSAWENQKQKRESAESERDAFKRLAFYNQKRIDGLLDSSRTNAAPLPSINASSNNQSPIVLGNQASNITVNADYSSKPSNITQAVGSGNSGNVSQLNNSPNSPINQNITNVNTGRRLRGSVSEKLIQVLSANPCPITVGVLGTGGEPEILANDFLVISKSAGCKTLGIFHGVGFDPFNGIQVKFSPHNTPTNSILAIIRTLQENHLDFASGYDPSQADGSIYIYVGFNP